MLYRCADAFYYSELAISRRQKEEETTQNRNNDRRSMISNLYMNIQDMSRTFTYVNSTMIFQYNEAIVPI